MNPLAQRAVLLGASLVVALSFHSLLLGLGWFLVVAAMLVLVASVGAVVSAFVRRPYGAPLAQVVALVVLLTVFFVPDRALLFLVPTPSSVGALVTVAQSGIESIQAQGVPANADAGIVLLLTAGLAAVSIIVDVVAVGAAMPALAGIPLLVVAAVPGLIDPTVDEPVFFVLLAAVYLPVLLTHSGRVMRGTALGAGAAAVVTALVLGIVLPPVVVDDTRAQVSRFSTGANPILDLGADLRRPNPITAFTYTTTTTANLYFTLTVLDDFDGDQWAPDTTAPVTSGVDAIGPVPGRPDDAAVQAVTTDVSVGDITGPWLPVPWAPGAVSDLDGSWGYVPDTLSIRGNNTSIRNQTYEVESALATPSFDQLEAAGDTVPSGFDAQLAVPSGLPAIVATTARQVTAGSKTHFEEALALQNWFRSGLFTYSVDAPVAAGYDGSGADVIAAFLDAKSGYCVHFSSAMAVMARTLGIPSRIGTGFVSGDVTQRIDGQARTVVSTDDLHAWPELYFDGVGWVRFEPTPGRGSAPAFPRDTSTSVPTSTPSSASATPSATPTSAATSTAGAEDPGTVNGSVGSTLARIASVLGILVAALLVLLLPFGVRRIRRRSRVARVDRTGDALLAWREITDTAIDLGLPVAEVETARALAARLSAALPTDAEAAFGRLLDAVERAAYAPAEGRATAADVRTATSALARATTRSRRIAARFWPVSLFVRR